MSMGGMALPPGVALAMQQQEEPTMEQKLHLNAVQLAINAFGVEGRSFSDDELIARSVTIYKLVNGEYDGKTEEAKVDEDKPVSVDEIESGLHASGLVDPHGSHLVGPEENRPV